MCGLLTLLTANADAPDHLPAVERAMPAMRHRGPDGSGTWLDQDVALGFHRLAVVDVEHSHQPLRWGPPEEPDRYVVVFNGEVYNHPELRAELSAEHGAQFRTAGDTEVVVAAHHHWGPAALPRLRGMFAFTIWDTRDRVLFAARDAFGVKPLYVATGPAGTAFGSEKKCLLDLLGTLDPGGGPFPADPDPRAVQDYLVLQYVPEPASMHRSVGRIESGCHATVRPGGDVAVRRWFTPSLRTRRTRETDPIGRITAALRDSVEVHLRSDVPVGAFLSGGIDSTAVVALAREHVPDLTTFTAGFERTGYSEVDVAAETADALGVRHVVRTVSAEEVAQALPDIVWALDDPVADPALVPLWFIAREAREHVTVVLSGEGADELFGGYRIYREPASLAAFDHLPGPVRGVLGAIAARLPEGLRGKDLLRRGALPLEQRHYGNARVFRPDQLAGLLRRHDPARSPADVTAEHYARSRGWDPVARMQHVDLFTWLRGDILVKADKMTMAHSLELRVPFLDREVFAAAAGLPPELKIAPLGGEVTTKYALRRAVETIVPPHVLHRPKLGFPVPVRHWLRDELHGWARDHIRDSGAGHLVDLTAVGRMLAEHRRGEVDHGRRLWSVLVLLIWHGLVVEGRIRPAVAPRRLTEDAAG